MASKLPHVGAPRGGPVQREVGDEDVAAAETAEHAWDRRRWWAAVGDEAEVGLDPLDPVLALGVQDGGERAFGRGLPRDLTRELLVPGWVPATSMRVGLGVTCNKHTPSG